MSKLGEANSLRQRHIRKLLKLEELFHSHYLTDDLLNEMISLYVQLSQNIEQGKNHVRLYFMEKIRFVLSRPEVIKSLDKSEVDQQPRNTIQQENSNGKQLEDRSEDESSKVQASSANRKKALQPPDLMQKQKNMKIEMQLKIMQQVQDNMNTFREDLNNQDKKRQEKQKQISKLVGKQDEALNQRRANRKKKRKRSSDFNQKQITSVQIPPVIALEELKNVHKEINQTYERFTRLTQNKLNANSNKKQNQGRVKYQIQERSYEQEEQDFFDVKKEGESKKQENKGEVHEEARARQTTTVEYGTFDKKNGRVTVKNNQYEQINQQEFF